MTRRNASSYIADIGKRATIKTVNGELTGTITIRFGRLCVEESHEWTARYATIHDDSEITIEKETPK